MISVGVVHINNKRETDAGVRVNHGTEDSDMEMVAVNALAGFGPYARGPPLFQRRPFSRPCCPPPRPQSGFVFATGRHLPQTARPLRPLDDLGVCPLALFAGRTPHFPGMRSGAGVWTLSLEELSLAGPLPLQQLPLVLQQSALPPWGHPLDSSSSSSSSSSSTAHCKSPHLNNYILR